MPNRLTVRGTTVGAALVGLASAAVAQAHAHLVTSAPAANAIGPAPAQIVLTFSEAPTPAFSGVELAPAAGPAVALKPSRIAGRKLVAAPVTPLRPGAYSVRWHAVAADTHRSTGAFSFTVR